MKQIQAQVLGSAIVASGIHLLLLRAPEVAAAAEPGQFVFVRCSQFSDPLLRRPLSIHRIGRFSAKAESAQDISLLIRTVGRGTAELASVHPGDTLDLVGPLGKGFTLKSGTRRLLLIAGGVGIAPMVAAADAAIRQEVSVTLLAGARTAAHSLSPQWLPPEIEYVVATEDGSLGQKGMVTDLLPSYLSWADQVFVCGPRPMLSAIKLQAREHAARFQVSLEERMACGVGACLGCVVEAHHGLQRVCRDGPVFDLKELRL